MRYREPFTLIKRMVNKEKKLAVYYYRLASDPSRSMRSTGQTSKPAARAYVEAVLARPAGGDVTLGEYQAVFWSADCPHLRRLADEGRRVTAQYAKTQRHLLDVHLASDALCKKSMADIIRGDILAYRGRLRDKLGDRVNTINKVMAAVKTIFREALLREDIDRDPTAGVGLIKEDRTTRGIFTAGELASIFRTCPGPWPTAEAYLAFALAASTGMRRGEILALRWRCVDTVRGVVRIEEAWKGEGEIGRPKSGRARVAPLTERMAAALDQVRGEPEAFVFGGKTMHLGTWWQKNFTKAMKAAGIATAGRNLTAHSFRHTLNTLLRDAGLDPAKIRAALGWSGVRIQDNYTHWQAEHLREIADEAGRAGL